MGRSAVWFWFLAVGMASCQRQLQQQQQQQQDDFTVMDVLSNLRAATFVTLLKNTGLDQILENSGPYTIFAPTDEAFNRLPGGIQQSLQEDPELLRRTLLYHISPGVREARALRNEIRVDTLVSDKQLTVRIYADKKPTVNSAVLTVPDARGSNGIVHIVSDVIYPIPEGDLWKTLESCNAFSSFAKLVREAELEDILSNTEKEEKWTIFVPVNAAFLLDESDKNDTNSLRELVRSHMVLGSHYSASLRDGLILYSVSAAATELEVGVRNGKLREVNIGRVLKADIPATNGVIHAIDRILLLPSIC